MRFDNLARESIMSAMRIGVLLSLLLLACGPRSVDVIMDPTSTVGVFRSKGVGTFTSPVPEYPEYIRNAGIEGANRISLRFTASWIAESVRVAKPSGNAMLGVWPKSLDERPVLW
jgi:hypothetical protein